MKPHHFFTFFCIYLCLSTHLTYAYRTPARISRTRSKLLHDQTHDIIHSNDDLKHDLKKSNSVELVESTSQAKVVVVDDALILAGIGFLLSRIGAALSNHYTDTMERFGEQQRYFVGNSTRLRDGTQKSIATLFQAIQKMIVDFYKFKASVDNQADTNFANSYQALLCFHKAIKPIVSLNVTFMEQLNVDGSISTLNDIADKLDEFQTKVDRVDNALTAVTQFGNIIHAGWSASPVLEAVQHVVGIAGHFLSIIGYVVSLAQIGAVLNKMRDEKFVFAELDTQVLGDVLKHANQQLKKDFCRTIYTIRKSVNTFFAVAKSDVLAAKTKTLGDSADKKIQKITDAFERKVTLWESTLRLRLLLGWSEFGCGCVVVSPDVSKLIKQDDNIVDIQLIGGSPSSATNKAKYQELISSNWELVVARGNMVTTDGITKYVDQYKFKDGKYYNSPREILIPESFRDITTKPCELNTASENLSPTSEDTSVSMWVKRKKNDVGKIPISHIVTIPIQCSEDSDQSKQRIELLESLGYAKVPINFISPEPSASTDCHSQKELMGQFDVSRGAGNCCARIVMWVKRGTDENAISNVRLAYSVYWALTIAPTFQGTNLYRPIRLYTRVPNVSCKGILCLSSNGDDYHSYLVFDYSNLFKIEDRTYLKADNECKPEDKGVFYK